MPTTPTRALCFLFGCWGALVLLAPIGASRVAAMEATRGPEGLARLEASLHAAVNAVREQRGFVPLARDPRLDRAARLHSADMARRGILAHETPEGRGPLDRIREQGLQGYSLAAENVGETSRGDPNREILSAWLRSPVHRQNLLAPAMNGTGVGVARAQDGRLFYTQLYVSFPRD